MVTAMLFVVSGLVLVLASALFTNAVEWAGHRLRLGEGATGSLLAALGTALPETIVPVVALLTGAPSADAVATGAVLGAPFLLMTVATAATGAAVALRRHNRTLVVAPRQVRQDLGVFLGSFCAMLLCIALPRPARIVVGVLLLMVYIAHVLATLRGTVASEALPEPLHIVRWRGSPHQPHGALIVVQLLIAVVLLVAASELFVEALDSAATALGIPALILAIIVVPLATELPESLNSVIWVRSNDDGLAFGNVAGSAAFQATVLGFVGVVFTSWKPSIGAVTGALLTLASAAVLLLALWRGRARGAVLMLAGIPWLVFVIAQGVTGGHLGG